MPSDHEGIYYYSSVFKFMIQNKFILGLVSQEKKQSSGFNKNHKAQLPLKL